MLSRGASARTVLGAYHSGQLFPVPALVSLWVDSGASLSEYREALEAGLVEGKISPFAMIQMGADAECLLLFLDKDLLDDLPTFYEWHLAEAAVDQILGFMHRGLVTGKTDPNWLWFAGADISEAVRAYRSGLLSAPFSAQDLIDRKAPFDLLVQAAREGMIARAPTLEQLLAAYDVSEIDETIVECIARDLVTVNGEKDASALASSLLRSKVHSGAWQTVRGSCVVCLEDADCLSVCKDSEPRHGHFVCRTCVPRSMAAGLVQNGSLACPICRGGLK